MKIVELYQSLIQKLSGLKSVPLLIMRLVLAYGFFGTAKMKWINIKGVSNWFESMGYPLPTFNAYMAAGLESIGVVLLILGLGTRMITVPLIIIMLVAVFTVHWSNGFEAGSNGFEIPLYYMIMLFTLMVYGGGKWSLDHLIGCYRKTA